MDVATAGSWTFATEYLRNQIACELLSSDPSADLEKRENHLRTFKQGLADVQEGRWPESYDAVLDQPGDCRGYWTILYRPGALSGSSVETDWVASVQAAAAQRFGGLKGLKAVSFDAHLALARQELRFQSLTESHPHFAVCIERLQYGSLFAPKISSQCPDNQLTEDAWLELVGQIMSEAQRLGDPDIVINLLSSGEEDGYREHLAAQAMAIAILHCGEWRNYGHDPLKDLGSRLCRSNNPWLQELIRKGLPEWLLGLPSETLVQHLERPGFRSSWLRSMSRERITIQSLDDHLLSSRLQTAPPLRIDPAGASESGTASASIVARSPVPLCLSTSGADGERASIGAVQQGGTPVLVESSQAAVVSDPLASPQVSTEESLQDEARSKSLSTGCCSSLWRCVQAFFQGLYACLQKVLCCSCCKRGDSESKLGTESS